MQVGNWQLARSYGSRLLINKKRQALWRFGWGRQGQGVLHNYTWLQKVAGVIPAPKPRTLRQYGPLVVSSESYVPGKPLAPHDITLEKVGDILAALAPLYRLSIIHGDLTHRNILSGSDGFYFIDGDRSEVAPPEFDVWLLLADSIAHSNGRGSHAEFIQQVWRTSPNETPYREATEKLYAMVPELADNRTLWPQLWQRFTARCLVHSITDCLRRGKSLDWLDGLT